MLFGCNSPVGVEHSNYYIRLNKHIDSVSASISYLEIGATTNIPGAAWAIYFRDPVNPDDRVITQQGVNWGGVQWYAVINPINGFSYLGGQYIGGYFVGDTVGAVTTRYGVYIKPELGTILIDTVIAYAYMSDIYIADTMRVVIY